MTNMGQGMGGGKGMGKSGGVDDNGGSRSPRRGLGLFGSSDVGNGGCKGMGMGVGVGMGKSGGISDVGNVRSNRFDDDQPLASIDILPGPIFIKGKGKGKDVQDKGNGKGKGKGKSKGRLWTLYCHWCALDELHNAPNDSDDEAERIDHFRRWCAEQ